VAYVVSGEGRLTVENRRFRIAAGDMLMVNDHEFHLIENVRSEPLHILSVFFLSRFVYQPGVGSMEMEYLRPFFKSGSGFVNRIPAKAVARDGLPAMFGNLHRELLERSELYPLAVKNELNRILLWLARYDRTRPGVPRDDVRKARDLERLRPVLSHLNSHFMEKVSLSRLSIMVRMSPAYFCRNFQKVTGRSLTDYVARMRVDHAKELLLSSDHSITEIAYETGFASHSYLDKIFRRLVGCSPQEFRNSAVRKR
jgi:AraC-like DNA-binding protein